MGFSTSGSLLLVFIGLFVAVGSIHTATSNTAERMAGATDDQREHISAVQQSQIDVANATWNETTSNLTVRVNNTGEAALSVDPVDVLADGQYVAVGDFDRVEVEGAETDIWRPGEQLLLAEGAAVSSRPERVKVVTGPGVADVATVEVVS